MPLYFIPFSGIGFGAHATWIITFHLPTIRQLNIGGSNENLTLTGTFGINGEGALGEPSQQSPHTCQGVIFVDGVLVHESANVTIW